VVLNFGKLFFLLLTGESVFNLSSTLSLIILLCLLCARGYLWITVFYKKRIFLSTNWQEKIVPFKALQCLFTLCRVRLMRLHRFYIEQPLGEELFVEQSELVHQWISVFRYKCEDEVVLFSSTNVGVDYIYRITSVNKKEVALSFVSEQKNILPNKNITLCMAIVKKDTFENIVRYATELGVSKIIPVLASRSEKKNLNLERLNNIAKEASEQSGRGDVPVISEILSFNNALEEMKGNTNIFTSLYGEASSELANKGLLKNNLTLWIGPEGGWTPLEEKLAKENNFHLMKLTETVLKADTAAICALTSLVLN